MALLAVDLGGTKLAFAVFTEDGSMVSELSIPLENRTGREVGSLITTQIKAILDEKEADGDEVHSIGVSVPGISYQSKGTVWAPNIPGWEDYPLLSEIREAVGDIPVTIDSDRACCILGELWEGAAQGCNDAIFLAVGTGIGAGILADGKILRGSNDISGAIGWMALDRSYESKLDNCGNFEASASGEGIARLALEVLSATENYDGPLSSIDPLLLTSHDVFRAYGENDPIAVEVFRQCVHLWGMAVANLVSLFNPEKIIFGGGVFGPAIQFLPAIHSEAMKWAQPISMKQVTIEPSSLGNHAALFGAGLLALQNKRAE